MIPRELLLFLGGVIVGACAMLGATLEIKHIHKYEEPPEDEE